MQKENGPLSVLKETTLTFEDLNTLTVDKRLKWLLEREFGVEGACLGSQGRIEDGEGRF